MLITDREAFSKNCRQAVATVLGKDVKSSVIIIAHDEPGLGVVATNNLVLEPNYNPLTPIHLIGAATGSLKSLQECFRDDLARKYGEEHARHFEILLRQFRAVTPKHDERHAFQVKRL